MNTKKEINTTVLFLDLRGSSRLLQDNNLKSFAKIICKLYTTGESTLLSADYIRFEGDEIMALYSDLDIAVKEAMELRDASTKQLFSVGLDAGIGIHRGFGFFSPQKDSDVYPLYLGDVFTIAKKLEGKSFGGDITISHDVFHALDPTLRKHFTNQKEVEILEENKVIKAYVSVRS